MLYNSPYSRYGIGQINSSANTYQLGQGGLSYTTNKFNQVNIANPASYPYIRKHTPIFDLAINGDFSEIKSSDSVQYYRNGSVANFTLGLPTSKRSGLVFSYQPYANMGYNIVDSLITQDNEEFSDTYVGNGGLNKLTAGFGYLIYRSDSTNLNVSIGLNGSYVFGNYYHQRMSDFPSGSTYNSLLVKDSTSLKDFILESGIMAEYRPGKNWTATLGVTYAFSKNLKSKNEFLAYTYYGNSSAIIDTLKYTPSTSGSIYVPSTLGVALELNYKHKIGLGLQYTTKQWSTFSTSFAHQSNVVFEDITELNAGLWYKPSGAKGNSNGGPLKNSTFKTGFRQSNLGLSINGTSINEIALSAGIHLPLVNSGSFSSVNFGTEFGKRGSIENGLVQEQFVRLRLGLSITPNINDRWFIKRKYD